jgi:T-complex protein 1 subunit gamma
LAQTEQYLQQGLHATVIIRAYRRALEDCINIMKTSASIPIDIKNRTEMLRVVKSCIGTKYLSRWLVLLPELVFIRNKKSFRSDLACQISLDAVQTVMIDENGRREIDIKRYARFEKVRCFNRFMIDNFLWKYRFRVGQLKIHIYSKVACLTKMLFIQK